MIQIVGSQLSQWDVGRSVCVSDSRATHVHFANQGDSKAPIIKIKDGEAKIPDYLLQTGKALNAYAVLDGVTLESRSFAVCKRERPENYVYEDDRRNYIYELITRAEDAVENANQAAQKANEAAEKLGSVVIPTKVSQLQNDSGFLTEAPVTAVNGQTGEVTVPTPVKVTVTRQSDGSYTADLRTTQILAAYQAGSAVYCCCDQLVLALSYAALARCIFTCIYNDRLHTVVIAPSGTTVTDTALGSGNGANGITPHIGANGNWYIGETDTGMPSRGEDAPQEAILYTPQTLTPEQQAQARENIGLDELPTGGSSNVFEIVETCPETVKQFSLELPVNWGRIKIINIHVNFGKVDTAFQLQGIFGGQYRAIREITAGQDVGLNLFCVKHMNGMFSVGIGFHVTATDSALAILSNPSNVRTNANDNTLSIFSKTADVLMPGGITFEIWGVYE